MLNDALTSSAPIQVPIGKYYLVDAGFSNKRGFLSPYRNVRYHLKEWRRSNLQPQNAKELFNLRHSSLRNVIERNFGLLKSRFKFLKTAPEYPLQTQANIVNVCCLLHNLLLSLEQVIETELQEIDEEAENIDVESNNNIPTSQAGEEFAESDVVWNTFRDDLVNRMWDDYSRES